MQRANRRTFKSPLRRMSCKTASCSPVLATRARFFHLSYHSSRLKERCSFVETFFFIITDYFLYTQLMVSSVSEAEITVDREAAGLVLATSIPPRQNDLAMAVVGLLTMHARRRFHLLSSVTKVQEASNRPTQPTGTGGTSMY